MASSAGLPLGGRFGDGVTRHAAPTLTTDSPISPSERHTSARAANVESKGVDGVDDLGPRKMGDPGADVGEVTQAVRSQEGGDVIAQMLLDRPPSVIGRLETEPSRRRIPWCAASRRGTNGCAESGCPTRRRRCPGRGTCGHHRRGINRRKQRTADKGPAASASSNAW